MLDLLYRYLILHDHVGVPGVGSFNIVSTPANISGNTIHPPKQHIRFFPGSALTDKQFYQFLSLEAGLSEVDAVRKFQDFAYQLRKDLQAWPQVALNGFGILKKTTSGEIAFEPVVSVDRYFSPLTATESETARATIHEQTVTDAGNGIEVYEEDEVVRKDRWWIWALLLTVLALAAIGYFYMQGEIL